MSDLVKEHSPNTDDDSGGVRPWPRRVASRLAGLLDPVPAWAMANLVAQIAIVVTGGLVRLTGSGLGCPTWPECFDGSLTPPLHPETGGHAAIEFGNRLLTFALTAIALGLAAAVLRARPRRRAVVVLGVVPFLGIVAQAVLGGMTVVFQLNPALVGAHFLLSMALISAATALVLLLRPGVTWPQPPRPELRWAALALPVVTAVVLLLGTMVTGSGPHAGDEAAPRYDLDIRAVTWLHADVVLLLAGLVLVLVTALRLTDAPRAAVQWSTWLLVVCLGQSMVGYLQYALGVPIGLVLMHMLGACLLVVTVTGLLVRVLATGSAAGTGSAAETFS